jgi:hypothetical protein
MNKPGKSVTAALTYALNRTQRTTLHSFTTEQLII